MRKIKKTSPRKKSANKKGRELVSNIKKIILIPIISYSLIFIISAVLLYISGIYDKTKQQITAFTYHVSEKTNLIINDVYLEGQVYSSKEDILSAINIKIGEPILGINIWKMKKSLEEIPWIKYATIERQYPSTLSIHIIENKPKALWQHNGEVYLIGSEGEIIKEKNLARFSDLIILVGKDVPSYAKSLLDILQFSPEISSLVSSAIRIGERRWNIRLYNGVEIKLPESDIELAWNYLLKLHKQNNILDSKIKTIDLRVPEKMFTTTNG